MKKKRKIKFSNVFAMLCAAVLLLTLFTVPAFAEGSTPSETIQNETVASGDQEAGMVPEGSSEAEPGFEAASEGAESSEEVLSEGVGEVLVAEEYTLTESVSNRAMLAASSNAQAFYSVEDLGEGDMIFYTYIDGVYVPAYCIDHGIPNPHGQTYSLNSATNNKLGYIMRNGYPSNKWGLSWQEAQFLTQSAVFGAVGVDLFGISNNLHSPYWIWNHTWGDGYYEEGDYIANYGHFQYALNLLSNANSHASSSDAAFVNVWTPNESGYQRMVTPVLNGSLKLQKSVSNGTGAIVISKTTSGSASDKDKEFTFKLVIKNASGQVQTGSYSYTGSKRGTISGNEGTVKLKHGQSITVSGIPAGYSFTVTETADSLFTTDPANRTRSGTIPAVGTSSDSFTFKVTFSDGGTYSYSGSKSGSLQSGKTLTLKGGQSVTFSGIPQGVTYRVDETAANGYTSSSSGASGTISAGDTKTASFSNTYQPANQNAAFQNTRKTTNALVTKTTSSRTATAQLAGNPMYSQDYSGAKFKVEVLDANTGSVTSSEVYTTDSSGSFTVSNLLVGDKLRITETQAPKGYVLPSSENRVKTITLAESGNTVTFQDKPTFSTAGIEATKACDLDLDVKVKGAVFKVEYFASLDLAHLGDAVRTWYFQTDANGKWDYAASTPLSSGDYRSAERYQDAAGAYALPIGTVRIIEVEAPAGYKRNETEIYKQITQETNKEAVSKWLDNASGTVTFESEKSFIETDEELVVSVWKVDAGILRESGEDRFVPHAKLELVDLETEEAVYSWDSGTGPEVIKNTLLLGHSYKIHEKSAPAGYKLAEDITFSIDQKGVITIDSPSWAETDVTEEGYTVIKMEDVKKVKMPVAGQSGIFWYLFGGGMAVLVSASALLILKRKGRLYEK